MKYKNLPDKIAVFPLSRAIFFPKTILPLNIFEDRYVQMINDCMKDKRLFGMVQPMSKFNNNALYKVGCLGKIINFKEMIDKRFTISLSGITRFRIKKEIKTEKLYREFEVDYSDFSDDLNEKESKEEILDENIIIKIKEFFYKKNYLIQLDELEKLNFDQLLSTICMISPFSAEEKQKLIEAIKIEEKISTLEEIINFNLFDNLKNKTMQ